MQDISQEDAMALLDKVMADPAQRAAMAKEATSTPAMLLQLMAIRKLIDQVELLNHAVAGLEHRVGCIENGSCELTPGTPEGWNPSGQGL